MILPVNEKKMKCEKKKKHNLFCNEIPGKTTLRLIQNTNLKKKFKKKFINIRDDKKNIDPIFSYSQSI